MQHCYWPSYDEIDKREFVKRYCKSYYLDGGHIVPNAPQTSRFVEDEMDRLLREGIKNEFDVVHILAWKVGGIDQKGSGDSFSYKGDWKKIGGWNGGDSALTVKLPRYRHPLALGAIAEYVAGNASRMHKQSIKDAEGAQNVFNELNEQGFDGLGATYLITLLYFISQGEWPIYDRFAKKAIDAICKGYEPGKPVAYSEPNVTKSVVTAKVAQYKQQLVEVFGDTFGKNCYKNRDIDRALWVYGHLFPDPEKN